MKHKLEFQEKLDIKDQSKLLLQQKYSEERNEPSTSPQSPSRRSQFEREDEHKHYTSNQPTEHSSKDVFLQNYCCEKDKLMEEVQKCMDNMNLKQKQLKDTEERHQSVLKQNEKKIKAKSKKCEDLRKKIQECQQSLIIAQGSLHNSKMEKYQLERKRIVDITTKKKQLSKAEQEYQKAEYMYKLWQNKQWKAVERSKNEEELGLIMDWKNRQQQLIESNNQKIKELDLEINQRQHERRLLISDNAKIKQESQDLSARARARATQEERQNNHQQEIFNLFRDERNQSHNEQSNLQEFDSFMQNPLLRHPSITNQNS